ncbi:glycosyltransferase family 4 protein [Variovorax sp. 160MFSha2.1]|uniref:glycosyltransferase family 4 protein n=1 Tax=Variovorax sp. 160MFSha2.1 TaxID=3158367 RepID=UPI003AAF0371
MRIVIDLQGAQNESRFRGIGRYSLALAQAMARNAGGHEILVALNGSFPDTIEPLRAALDGLVPQDNIRIWRAPGPVDVAHPENEARRSISALIREDFLACLQPDIVHVTSLFDGLGDETVCTIRSRLNSAPTAVSFYDAIPLIYPEQYLAPNPAFEAFYRHQIEHLKRADLLLAISESAAREAEQHVGISNDRIVSISSAADEIFRPGEVSQAEEARLRTRLGISKSFIMYSSGADERKNHLRLIDAFSRIAPDLRAGYSLVFVGGMPADRESHFRAHASSRGLGSEDFILTGRVSDSDLVNLYRLCSLFVFPSISEGFGLPALEAMSCGTPTLASNTTSLPEVMGREEAMFDPLDVDALTRKISTVLSSDELLARLKTDGLEQARRFSWDHTAKRALLAMEKLHSAQVATTKSHRIDPLTEVTNVVRLAGDRLSTDDLLLVSQSLATNAALDARSASRQLLVDISEVLKSDGKSGVQRVVHGVLRSLIASPPPGFRIEPIYSGTEDIGFRYARRFVKNNYAGADLKTSAAGLADDVIEAGPGDVFLGLDLHHAIIQRHEFFEGLRRNGIRTYFVLYDLLPLHLPQYFFSGLERLHSQWVRQICRSDGVICISNDVAEDLLNWLKVEQPKRLRQLNVGWWHLGFDESKKTVEAPSAPSQELLSNITKHENVFLAVGTVEPRKGHAQLLSAFEFLWSRNIDACLVIVGKCGWSVEDLSLKLQTHRERGSRLFWLENADDATLNSLYRTASCLIAPSFAEGFGLPLIEAASHGIPIIARDIPVFHEVAAGHAYYFRGETSEALALAIEKWLVLREQGAEPPSDGIPRLNWSKSTQDLTNIFVNSNWQYAWKSEPRLFLDVSTLIHTDARTGVQRVVRSLLQNLLKTPPKNTTVCPIWFDGTDYRHAVKLVARIFRGITSSAEEPVVKFEAHDCYLALDLNLGSQPSMESVQARIKAHGTRIWFLVYDLLPIHHPEWWVPGMSEAFNAWFESATRVADGFVCISEATAIDVREVLSRLIPQGQSLPEVRSFHIGADIENSLPNKGLPHDAEKLLAQLRQHPSFLMVGTIEPRKGHSQALAAFEQLWGEGLDISLVIVGKAGWMVDDLVRQLSSHPRLGKGLHVLQTASDEYLARIYAESTCLLAPSEGEGFGLPLIEAAQHGLPILARDLPVFKEVAGAHAAYFHGREPGGLAAAIKSWLALHAQDGHPKTQSMPWLTWEQSARQLETAINFDPVNHTPPNTHPNCQAKVSASPSINPSSK